jgi:hypothetical protein
MTKYACVFDPPNSEGTRQGCLAIVSFNPKNVSQSSLDVADIEERWEIYGYPVTDAFNWIDTRQTSRYLFDAVKEAIEKIFTRLGTQ